MARYSDTLRDQNERPIEGALTYVVVSGTNELAALTDDEGNALGNPFETNEYGAVIFNTADGLYDLSYRYGGRLVFEEQRVVVGTPASLPLGAVVNSLGDSTVVAPSQAAVQDGLTEATTFLQSGAGAVSETVSDALGRFVWADQFGGDIEAAIASLPAEGGTVLLDVGEYTSPYQNQNLPTTIPTNVMTRDNITIEGRGQPTYAADFSELVGGSIIKGSFFYFANNFTIRNLGIDCGSDFCDANYSGTPQEVLIAYDAEQLGGPAVDYLKNATIENITLLGHKTGKSGDTSDVHVLLLENYDGWSIRNVTTVMGGAGIVIKSKNGSLAGAYCRGHFKYSVLNKSESYSAASFNTYSDMTFANLLDSTPSIGTASDYDTSGFVVQASSAHATGIVVNKIVANGVINPVFIQGLSTWRCTDIVVNDVTAQNVFDAVAKTSGTCWRVKFSNVVGNVANYGVQFSSASTWCSAMGCEMQGVNGYSYENSGTECRIIACASDSPAVSHIRIISGSLYVMGGFRPVGSGSFLTTIGGAIVGTGLDDQATGKLLYLSSSNNVGIGTPTPGELLEVNGVAKATAFKVGSNEVVRARLAALPADATDLATALTLVNAVKARMKATGGHGLVAD